MEQNILKQLELIEKSNAWIKSYLDGEKQKNAHRTMVDYRRKLNKKKFALEGNPAAAMFGESQAGKSYLVSALLSEAGSPFKILDGKGNEFDFKNQINPRGNEMESTSVVTRFSTKYKWINQDYPIIAKLLSPTDIILVICEAYFNNLRVNNPLGFDEIKEKISSFERLYNSRSECQKLIIEDDVLDIEEYFENNFSKLVYNNIKDANFFEKISVLVTKIAPEEWRDVFSLFWNFNPQLTKLFDDLIKQYKQLNFVDTVYLPIDAVLRNKGTLLDVNRLDEIYGRFKGQETEYSEKTTVFFMNKGGNDQTVEFSKPYLCALTAELIFVLPDIIKNDKRFLVQTDLLDFPGTRRFENTGEDSISDKSLTELLRRGRVDYLFNKYSSNERINALLFCQNHKQSNQSVLPEKLNRWIGNMIGNTQPERENFKSPIAPLFVISTWFNKDLEFDFSSDKEGVKQSLNQRWEQRFSKTLEEETFKVHEYPWLIEWTISKPNFQNIFLLRDFEKSGTDVQNCSNIFKGYNENKRETEEIIPDSYPNFRKDLRQSFIEYPFVKRHFENPANSWDEAASINKDGTKLIIEKLTIAADHINPARIAKMSNELNEISQSILTELLKYFHSNDKDEELQKAKSRAGDIQHKLDTAFSADGIKLYGQLMKELMLDESTVLELYRKKIDDIEHREVIIMDKYSTYRMHVPVIVNDTVDTYFERLCTHYEKTTAEEKQQFLAELEARKIDLEELINGNSDLIKNNAQQLAEALLEYWFAYVTLNDKHTIQEILAKEGSSALQDITDMFQKLFKKLGIPNRIAEKIRRYVDGHNRIDLPYEIVADISAELLNKCINTVGFEYLDETEINDLQQANEKNGLGLVLDQRTNPVSKSVEDLFTKIENWTDIIQSKPEEMKSLPNYRNYLSWYNRLKVGFVFVCDIPNYDVTANEKLDSIIKECKTIKY
ncbi:virulence factor SrfC family protein [Runella sp.]|uniref:virulence factor SrfC family protein n=1 Tax=Runella sp. TaxID=1960881 RepID=UPI0030194041